MGLGSVFAHALKATDVLDTIEAYGLDVQNVTHRGPYLATLLVVYHAVIELFMLGMLWAIVGVWKRHVMNDSSRARLIRRTLWLSFGVWLIAWLVSALWLRPWRPIDIPLWLAENVVRVLDFADAMDSYDIHWHQVPRGPWESTLTFVCRVWVGLGVGLFLNWRAGSTKARPGVDHHKVPSFSRVARLGVAVVILGSLVAVSEVVAANVPECSSMLVDAAGGGDDVRATAALNALRRLGPNAGGVAGPLAEARGRVGPDRRRKITETLGYLGPAAVDAMADIAASGDAAEAMLATEGLERVGPSAAPSLVLAGKGSPHEQVRSRTGEALRRFGPKAMKALVEGVTPENSADFYPWFVELDRNWTLRSSPNPTFRAIVTYHHGKGKLLVDLTGKDDQVREAAVQILALIGPVAKDTIPALVAALTDKDWLVRQAAAAALLKIGPVAVPALIKALTDNEPEVRSTAAEALGRIGPGAKDAVTALVTALDDKKGSVRWAAAAALGKIGPGAKDAVTALVTALAAGDVVESAAAEALGRIDPNWAASPLAARAVPALVIRLADKEGSVRSAAAEALGKIGPGAKDAVTALVTALADKEGSVRWSAAKALGKIGPGAKDAVTALVTALGDKYEWVRRSAAEALGEIGPGAKDALSKLREVQAKDIEQVKTAATRATQLIDLNPTKP